MSWDLYIKNLSTPQAFIVNLERLVFLSVIKSFLHIGNKKWLIHENSYLYPL